MATTARQRELFHKLTTDREFPEDADLDALRNQFAGLSVTAGSEWIEKAMTLPRTNTPAGDDGENAPAPF